MMSHETRLASILLYVLSCWWSQVFPRQLGNLATPARFRTLLRTALALPRALRLPQKIKAPDVPVLLLFVDLSGFEPLTFRLQSGCSTN
jgi:hypothetical protein